MCFRLQDHHRASIGEKGKVDKMRKLLVIAIALVLVGLQIPAAFAQEATPMPGATPAPGTTPTAGATPTLGSGALIRQRLQSGQVCAWPVQLSRDALNVAFPDANAVYFVMPYSLGAGQSLIVKGAYPFARFFSLTTYYGVGDPNSHGVDVLGWLRDNAIAPDPGSSNPAVDPNAPTDPAQRRWTVRVTGTAQVGETTPSTTPSATPTTGENVIPAHQEGVSNAIGLLVLRIYVPDDPNSKTGGVPLPSLTLQNSDGTQHTLAKCTGIQERIWTEGLQRLVVNAVQKAPRLPLPPSPDATPVWVASSVPGIGPNPDNRYLMTPIAWKSGRIVVIRGKAPTFPDARAGQPITTAAQLRYWSFCTGSNVLSPDPYPTTDCVGDFQIPVRQDGTYTIVVSQPQDRPDNAITEQGIAWLRGADPALPDLIVLRHMLPSQGFFNQSVWAVPENVPGAAQSIMGPYYPQAVYCDKATFEAGGADACFAKSGAATPTATPATSTPAG